MQAFRIGTGLMLVLVVSVINGVSAMGYTIGGEFEISMQTIGDGAASDPRWQKSENGTESTLSPRDDRAALSLLWDSKFGRFGLLLQVLCLLQFIAGVLIVIKRSAGVLMLAFVVLIVIAGILAEAVGAQLSSSWGFTNFFGVIVSVLLVPVVLNMYRNTNDRSKIQNTA